MGRDSITIIHVTASVSRHNSPEDREDDALADELRARLTAIVEEPKYEQITAMAHGC